MRWNSFSMSRPVFFLKLALFSGVGQSARMIRALRSFLAFFSGEERSDLIFPVLRGPVPLSLSAPVLSPAGPPSPLTCGLDFGFWIVPPSFWTAGLVGLDPALVSTARGLPSGSACTGAGGTSVVASPEVPTGSVVEVIFFFPSDGEGGGEWEEEEAFCAA